MERSIPAIPTTFRGIEYRSRLEARWSIFLNMVEAAPVYEAEGFSLPSGRYLPDFWLHKWGTFVEIKPTEPTEHEVQLCRELARATGHSMLLIHGNPMPNTYAIRYITKYDLEGPHAYDAIGWDAVFNFRSLTCVAICDREGMLGCTYIYDPNDRGKGTLGESFCGSAEEASRMAMAQHFNDPTRRK